MGARGRKSASGLVRVQRVIADAGLASRRNAELLVREGRVRVNGEVARELPVLVDPARDRVSVDGREVATSERHVYVVLNKPGRTLSTVADEPGAARRTVLDLVDHPSGVRLYPVGRLDYETTGMVLLTNDGELANRLTHPRFGVEKTYHVVVKGRLEDEEIEALERGIYLADRREGRTVGAVRAAHVKLRIVRRDAERTSLRLSLKEGRNRQVRRMLSAVGRPVKKLERVAIGPLEMKGLARGQWRELDRRELRVLREAVGLRGASGAAQGPRGGAGGASRDGTPLSRRGRPKAPADGGEEAVAQRPRRASARGSTGTGGASRASERG